MAFLLRFGDRYINPVNVAYVRDIGPDRTTIKFVGADDSYITVNGDAKVIANEIDDALIAIYEGKQQ